MKDLRTDPQFKLRLPQSLKDRVDESAKQNNRSINAEIVQRLERSYANSDIGFKGDSLDMSAFFAMALLIANDEQTATEERKAILARARDIARPLIEGLVFSKLGSTTVEKKSDS